MSSHSSATNHLATSKLFHALSNLVKNLCVKELKPETALTTLIVVIIQKTDSFVQLFLSGFGYPIAIQFFSSQNHVLVVVTICSNLSFEYILGFFVICSGFFVYLSHDI